MSMTAIPILHHRSAHTKDRRYHNLEDNVILKPSQGNNRYHVDLKLETKVKRTAKARAMHAPRLGDVEPTSKALMKKTCREKRSAAKDALQQGTLRPANNRRVSSSSRRASRPSSHHLDVPELPVSKSGGLPRVAIGTTETIASSDPSTKVPTISNDDDRRLGLSGSDDKKLRAKPERLQKRRSQRHGVKNDLASSKDDSTDQRNMSLLQTKWQGGDSTDYSFGKQRAGNGKGLRSECGSAVTDKGARRRTRSSPSRAKSESYLLSSHAESRQKQSRLSSLRSLQRESDEYWRSMVTQESSRNEPALPSVVSHLPSDVEEMAALMITNIRKTLDEYSSKHSESQTAKLVFGILENLSQFADEHDGTGHQDSTMGDSTTWTQSYRVVKKSQRQHSVG